MERESLAQKQRKGWVGRTVFLTCTVIFVLVCGMILPAIAMEQTGDENNRGKLTIVESADTSELIEVNLYDYDSKINTLYEENNNYPAFQQEYGSKRVGDSFSKWASFNFGNNITSDLAAGKADVTNKGGAINATTDGANRPISGAMSKELQNGYPALANGISLAYLFSDNEYATKQNKKNINGLFQYNKTTGAYTFNSRENHAQFNPGEDTFTLYEQILTSNFMMYPFGNFLPFNDITRKSAQVSTIDRTYLQAVAESAQDKQNAGMSTVIVPNTGTESPNEYGLLATQLNQFITLMDNAYGSTWTATDSMNEYFKASGIARTFEQKEALLQQLYSIDFDEPTDFYFGMDMKMNFMQPKGGLTGNDGKQPMVFYFTGDDDVWVYIDDQLFLDLSGIHRHVGGEIDFVNGTVSYFALDITTGDVAEHPYQTVTFEEILGSAEGLNENGTFLDYTTHSFRFYYMERGSGSSVCRMNFNFPLLRKNTISVEKELTSDQQNLSNLLGNPDFKFQILKADSQGNQTENLFIGAGVTYHIYNENNEVVGTGVTDTDGVFTLKAGQRAEFAEISENAGKYYVRELLETDAFAQYGTIIVNGSSTTTNYDVVVGTDTFTGVTSMSKDASDGSTVFTYNNQITWEKLGRLEITKNVEAYPQSKAMPQFRFEILLDGAPLPIGTEYVVDGEIRKVTEEGGIVLAAGEVAQIPNIIVGTQFVVKETKTSAEGYTVAYRGSEGVLTDAESAFGTIRLEEIVKVEVINREKGIQVILPGAKELLNADGQAHTYTFKLEQVTDSSGETLVENGTTQEVTVFFPEGTTGEQQDFQFVLNYGMGEYRDATFPVSLFYRITEIPNGEDNTRFDISTYVVEVQLKNMDGEWKAEVIGCSQPIHFQNELYSKLSISKTVDGGREDQEFAFEILLTKDGIPLQGTYVYTRSGVEGEQSLSLNAEGIGEFRLKHGEEIAIFGLSAGTEWRIIETTTDGYVVSHKVDDADKWEEGSTVQGELPSGSAEAKVTFLNRTAYRLPQMGGTGTWRYQIGGIIMIAMIVFLQWRKNIRFIKQKGK